MDTVLVVLNANDLTVNLCGTTGEHKGFADVGEEIENGILLARRRINHESILYDLATPQLSAINWEADTVFYAEGRVVDIDIYSNLSATELEKYPFNRQILAYHERWVAFSDWFLEVFGETVTGGGNYSNDVGYWYRTCHNTAAGKWRHERSEFDGVVLRFTIARRSKATDGTKITNR